MITIRNDQLSILGREPFLGSAAAHLERHFPAECAALGPDRLRTLVQAGLDRAQSHGLRSERDVCRFLNLMFIFGVDFDRTEAWAREALARPGSPAAVASRLYARAILNESSGKGLGLGIASSEQPH